MKPCPADTRPVPAETLSGAKKPNKQADSVSSLAQAPMVREIDALAGRLHYAAYSWGFEVGRAGQTIESTDAMNRADSAYRALVAAAAATAAKEQENQRLKADAERYQWLRSRLVAADFAWGEPAIPVLVFSWPSNVGVGGNCDQNIDAARAALKEPSA